MLKLNFKDSRQAPIWLVEERFTIGRDGRNQLALDDTGVGDFHVEIRRQGDHYYLNDCGSEGGTFVNDVRIAVDYQLRPDDTLRIGTVEMQLFDPNRSRPKEEVGRRWYLQVIKGEHKGRKFHVQSAMTFGRSTKCDLCFSDPELSRRHGEFFLKNNVLEIIDLSSANGIHVNGKRISSAVLHPGDQIRIGSVTLLVIGPKVELQQTEDEDATVFMAAVDVPKAEKPKTGGRTPVANPLHAAARADAASEPAGETKASSRGLVFGLVAGAGLLAVAVLVVLFR